MIVDSVVNIVLSNIPSHQSLSNIITVIEVSRHADKIPM